MAPPQNNPHRATHPLARCWHRPSGSQRRRVVVRGGLRWAAVANCAVKFRYYVVTEGRCQSAPSPPLPSLLSLRISSSAFPSTPPAPLPPDLFSWLLLMRACCSLDFYFSFAPFIPPFLSPPPKSHFPSLSIFVKLIDRILFFETVGCLYFSFPFFNTTSHLICPVQQLFQ